MVPDNSNAPESLYWAMQDLEKKLTEVIMRIADMAFKQMTLEKALYPDECWTTGYEERRQRLYDLSKNAVLSEREARLGELAEAKKWLSNYGGSPQRKKRGLGMIDTAIEHVKGGR